MADLIETSIFLPFETDNSTAKSKPSFALFLGDLSIFCTESDVQEVFAPFGEIVSVKLQRSKDDSRGLSYGFISFTTKSAAAAAMNNVNGFVLKGRPLR